MQKFLSVPNVSNFFTILLTFYVCPSLSAYKVLDDEYLVQEDAPIIQKDSPQETIQKSETVYHYRVDVPFHAKRFQLGTRGKETLQKAIKEAGQFTIVRIVGKGDRPGDSFIAEERVKTVRSFIAKRNTAEINSIISDEVAKDKSPDIYTIAVEFGNSTRITVSNANKQPVVIAHSTIFDEENVTKEKDGQADKVAVQKPPAIKNNWALMKHLTLRENLANWCKEAGWNDLVWKSEDPYALDKSVTLRGTFVDVISALAKGVPGLDFEVDKKSRRLTVTEAK